jgi:hypothetical protein
MKQIFFLLIVLSSNIAVAQWSPEKIQHKREAHHKMNDSAWTYDAYRGIWLRHNFLGTQKVSWKFFLQGLNTSDDEVGNLVSKYKRSRVIGFTATTASTFFLFAFAAQYTSSPWGVDARPVLLLSGAAAFTTGFVFLVMADIRIKKAIKLFNYKSRNGTLQKTEVQKAKLGFLMRPNSVGLTLNF